MKKLNLFVCIDGLGWEVLKNLSSFNFIQGTRKPLDTVLGFSSSAIPSILTGKYPDEHGLWNLFYYDPTSTDFPAFKWNKNIPTWINRNRYIRKLQLLGNKLYTGFEGYYQAYNYPSEKLSDIRICENKNIYMPQGISNQKSIFDIYTEQKKRYLSYSYKSHTTQSIFNDLVSDVQFHQPESVFIYIADFDAFGHQNATDHSLMVHEAEIYGEKIHQKVRQLEDLGWDVSLSVFSDHGMVPLKGTVDIFKIFDDASEVYPNWIIDSTMMRLYSKSPEQVIRMKELFSEIPGTWLDEDLVRKYFVEFNGKYGDEIFVLDSGYQFSPSHMGKSSCPGMHGYFPNDPFMKASFISTTDEQPAHIIDLFQVLQRN